MSQSIDEARAKVQSAVTKLLVLAERDESRRFFEFEAGLKEGLRELGCALIVLFLTVQVGRPRARRYRHGGHLYELAEDQTLEFGVHCGKVQFRRPVGRQPDKPRRACDRVVDRELGLCSGFSIDVVQGLGRLCALMAFATARSTYKEFHGWTPAPRAVYRMVDALGAQARPFLEDSAAPEGDGSILVIQVDGKGAPMISEGEYEQRCQPHEKRQPSETQRGRRRRQRQARPRRRRKPGEKSKNAKVAFVGVIYTLERTSDGLEGPLNKRVYATFESHEALFVWLHREAVKRGYGTKEMVFLADGSEHIWRLQRRYFPAATPCLDWYHLVEHLWEVSRSYHGSEGAAAAGWVARQTTRLRRGATMAVRQELGRMLGELPKTGPGNKAKRAALTKMIHYYDINATRMPYREFLQSDLDIGSGAVEGAVRNLVGMRLDGPGMRWGRLRAERVLHLRCVLLNEQWEDFVHHVASQPEFRLCAQPEEAVPHCAELVAA